MYKLFTGKTPFKDINLMLTVHNICKETVTKHSLIPDDAFDLIERLLVIDPNERIGLKPEEGGF
jgi:serine/threonine protein kinase